MTRITGTLQGEMGTFITIFFWVLLQLNNGQHHNDTYRLNVYSMAMYKVALEYMCAGHAVSEFKSCQLSGHNKCVQKHLTVDYFDCSYVKGSNTATNIEVVNMSLGGRKWLKEVPISWQNVHTLYRLLHKKTNWM